MRLLLCFLFLWGGISLGAQVTVSGVITEKDSGETLPLATVLVQETSTGISADSLGRYSLEIDATLNTVTLQVSYTGAITKEVKITLGSKSIVEMDIELEIGITCFLAPVIFDSPLTLSSPAPQIDITTTELNRDIQTSIAPVLNRVPGVYMQSGALNTNRVTMRGIGNRSLFSTTKIRAYLDDIPLTSGDGETTIEDIDMSLIDRVKVWRGPTASVYGAGLGGMIHFQTTNRSRQYERSVSTDFSVGSFGLLRNSTSASFSTDKSDIRLNYNNTHSDGYRENNSYDREGAAVLMRFAHNEKNLTTFFANYLRLKAQIPSSINLSDFEQNPTLAATNWFAVGGFEDYDKTLIGAAHRVQIFKNEVTKLHNRTAVFAFLRDSYELRPFNILQEESAVIGARTVFELDKQNYKREFPLLAVGAELFRENYDWQTKAQDSGNLSDLLSDNSEVRTYYNLFAQVNLSFQEKLKILAGLNLNNTNYRYTDLFLEDGNDLSGNYGFNPVLSPRLGLSYTFKGRNAVFANISHGFSPPSLSETLTPDGTINPDIQPEKGWNFEVGSRGKFGVSSFEYELTLYDMRIRDLLVARRTAEDQFIGINAGKTQHRGVEVYLAYKLSKNSFNFKPWLTYTYSDYKFLEFQDGENDFSGNDLTGTPPHNLNAGIDISSTTGFYGNLNFQYVAGFPMRDDNSIYSESYHVLNSKVGFRKTVFSHFEIDVYAGIANITDEAYASMILINARSFGGNAPRYYYPGLPRNFFGGIKGGYNF